MRITEAPSQTMEDSKYSKMSILFNQPDNKYIPIGEVRDVKLGQPAGKKNSSLDCVGQ